MGLPNKDEVQGKANQAKGAIKETIGRAVGDSDLESEGAAERTSGHIQEGTGKARRKVGDAISDVGNTVRR